MIVGSFVILACVAQRPGCCALRLTWDLLLGLPRILPEPCKLLGFHQVNALVVRFDRRIFLLDLREPLVRGREPWFEGGFIDPLPAPNAGRTASAVMAQMPERVFCN